MSQPGHLLQRSHEPETAGVCPDMERRLNISGPGASPTPLVDGAPQLAASRSRQGHAVIATLRACELDGRPEAHPWHDRLAPRLAPSCSVGPPRVAIEPYERACDSPASKAKSLAEPI